MTQRKIKVGTKVTITRKPTRHYEGKVTNIYESGRGLWYEVNVGTQRDPVTKQYRISDLA